MKKCFRVFIIFLAVVTGCKHEEEVVPNRVIFKFTMKSPIHSNTNRWIVLRDDETGELIESRQLTVDGTATFESTKKIGSGKLSVSYFKAPDFASDVAIIDVFAGIDVGSEWTSQDDSRDQYDPDTPFSPGNVYSLTINNAPDFYSFTLTDKYGPVDLDDPKNNNGTIAITAGFNEGYTQLLSIYPAGGKQKYIYIDDIEYREEIVLDYNDLKEFDKYIPVEYTRPADYIFMQVYPGPAKYANTYSLYETIRGIPFALNLGVLDEFPVYSFQVFSDSIYHTYLGPAPSAITRPHIGKFTIKETAIDKYTLTASEEYNHRTVYYKYNPAEGSSETYIDLRYHGPAGDWKQYDPLTDELVTKFALKMDQVQYSYTDVSTGTQTYSKLLDYYFAPEYDSNEPYEIIRISL